MENNIEQNSNAIVQTIKQGNKKSVLTFKTENNKIINSLDIDYGDGTTKHIEYTIEF